MRSHKNRPLVFLAIAIGTIIGLFKGEEAKQKWFFKMKSKYDNKRLIAERKLIARNGGVQLDEIEISSYHAS